MNVLSIATFATKDVRTPLVHLSVPVMMDMFSLVMEGHALVSPIHTLIILACCSLCVQC